ncbi:MAG: AmmeMemoRadiSam system radical SAM enzyme [Lentisphaerae bacterium GWF2_52_8]|nr:MAG: AmmeMemoRadiSam system radical SAM enzyme [Lentisphaerae bacterium GWF2_52_8]
MPVQCELCPRACILRRGESGDCRARINIDGKLVASTYGFPCALHNDPVEKKPVFHFLPGSSTFSLATAGCNLHCKNCQNWEISQAAPESVDAYSVPPAELIALAMQNKCKSLSYTYTDPVIFYEYVFDSAELARKKGLKNIMVTAGYINKAPFRELCGRIDVARIDLKAMSDKFYQDVCGATLAPVLAALEEARSTKLHIEVINLLIPTLNDSEKDIKSLARWISSTLGPEIPLHFSRFFPNYRMRNLPATSEETLLRARQIAHAEGLQYVYIGNVSLPDAENTRCPACGALLIRRIRYSVMENKIKNGKCYKCGKEIYGVWE